MTDQILQQRAHEAAIDHGMWLAPDDDETNYEAFVAGYLRGYSDRGVEATNARDEYLAAATLRDKEIAALKARQTAKEILDTGGEWRELTDREIELLTMAVMPDLLEEDQRPGRDRLARLVCKAHELLSRARDKELEIAVLKARVAELEADASAVAIQEKRMYLSLPETK